MRHAWLLLAPVLALAACGESQTPPSKDPIAGPGDPARGKDIAVANCAECHAVGPMGDSPYPPAIPFREIHKKYPVENIAEALAEGTLVGHKGDRQMPEFELDPAQIEDLLAYMKSLETPAP